MAIRELKTKSDLEEFLNEPGPQVVVIDCYAVWCGPCKVIGPKFEALVKDVFSGRIRGAKIDVDEAEDLAQEFGIKAMPTFKIFKDKKPIAEVVGAAEAKLRSAIEKALDE
ncbi:uncharacterized protein [Oscarella lobularis]|uniref:uncharacterized protein n=1 Tax=Oscarella lobularis TaxID=121494 RepID=UPI0033135680